jgi:hypothetical protein
VNNEQEKGGDSLPLGRYTPTYQMIRRITALNARTPVPIISKASATSGVKETAPPVSVSAEALLLAAGRLHAALHRHIREQRLAGRLWLMGMGIQEDESLCPQPI